MFTTKHVQLIGLPNFWGWRNSYMHVGPGLLTIPSGVGIVHLGTPVVIKSGTLVHFSFQNASQERQNMAGYVMGRLVPV